MGDIATRPLRPMTAGTISAADKDHQSLDPDVGEQSRTIARGLTQPRVHALEHRSVDRRRRNGQVDVPVRASRLTA